MIAVDAAHWWGPAGWIYRNTPGNLAASAMAFTAGSVWGYRKVLKPHLDRIHDSHEALHAKVDALGQSPISPIVPAASANDQAV